MTLRSWFSVFAFAALTFSAPAENSTVAAPDQIAVNVLGSIRTPGRYNLSKGASVLDALAAAGGAVPSANLNKVLLIHRTQGKPDTATINVHQILSGSAQNVPMRDGDTLNVPRVFFRFDN